MKLHTKIVIEIDIHNILKNSSVKPNFVTYINNILYHHGVQKCKTMLHIINIFSNHVNGYGYPFIHNTLLNHSANFLTHSSNSIRAKNFSSIRLLSCLKAML